MSRRQVASRCAVMRRMVPEVPWGGPVKRGVVVMPKVAPGVGLR
jgi:hypothetical protein